MIWNTHGVNKFSFVSTVHARRAVLGIDKTSEFQASSNPAIFTNLDVWQVFFFFSFFLPFCSWMFLRPCRRCPWRRPSVDPAAGCCSDVHLFLSCLFGSLHFVPESAPESPGSSSSPLSSESSDVSPSAQVSVSEMSSTCSSGRLLLLPSAMMTRNLSSSKSKAFTSRIQEWCSFYFYDWQFQ